MRDAKKAWDEADPDLRKAILTAVHQDDPGMPGKPFGDLPEIARVLMARTLTTMNTSEIRDENAKAQFLKRLNYLYAKETGWPTLGNRADPQVFLRSTDTFLETWDEHGMRDPTWAR